MKKVLILTGIIPNKDNRGGPSGLIWECIEVLKRNFIDYDLTIKKTNGFLNKLGIYQVDNSIEYKNYSHIFVYPFNVAFAVPKNYRQNLIILGPDSPSLLFVRFCKNENSFLKKIRSYLLYQWFLYKENEILNDINKFLVVGNNDSRWLQKKHSKLSKGKIQYLTHPILKSISEGNSSIAPSVKNTKIFVFAGDMSQKYTGELIFELKELIHSSLLIKKIEVLIVGKNNQWIYKLLKHPLLKITYLEWVENYSDICIPEQHIHIIPLKCGAGTKNRTLSACANGVTIISTSIGLENIMYCTPPNTIYKANTSIKILQSMEISLNKDIKSPPNNTLENFILRVNNKFETDLIQNFLEQL